MMPSQKAPQKTNRNDNGPQSTFAEARRMSEAPQRLLRIWMHDLHIDTQKSTAAHVFAPRDGNFAGLLVNLSCMSACTRTASTQEGVGNR